MTLIKKIYSRLVSTEYYNKVIQFETVICIRLHFILIRTKNKDR